jgi:lactate dehydrogenase-like 2-hydroxyacid dehydrogenase
MHDVYVTRRVPREAIDMLREAGCNIRQWDDDQPVPYDVLSDEVVRADGIYTLLTDRIDAPLMDRGAGRLKVISQMAVGYDNIDIDGATQRGLPVGHTPGVLTETTADLTWALLMAVARRLVEAAAAVKSGEWTTWLPMWMTGPDVHGASLGIIGAGRIGVAMTKRAAGFDMTVRYTDAVASPGAEALGAERVDLDTLLAESDFVTLHTPLLPETRHLVNEGFLKKMRPGAILINTSRGPVVDEPALFRALSEGWIRGAGLDVTEQEPLPLDSPLLTLPNLLVLPHIGSASVATRTRMATMAAENLLAGLRGERLPYCVNCDALGPAS